MSLRQIFSDCSIHVNHHKPVSGGDINDAYCLQTDKGNFFLKVNDARLHPGLFKKEANGLEALSASSSCMVPHVIRQGVSGDYQYLLLEWIEKGAPAPDCMKQFGASLASLHRPPQPYFGWTTDNFIGSLPQLNTPCETWPGFYAECRILPLVRILRDNGSFSKEDMAAATSLCNKLEQLFPNEHPSLLHGDLWGGNYMITQSGYAAIYDPAVYCGHREMDIGMTRLFGGFGPVFYEGYNEVYPLEKGWEQRLALTQFYPLLVHSVLFDGHYTAAAREIILRYA